MGCDIHGVLQTRFKNVEGKWASWDTKIEIHDDRHYLVFAALAGVRNYYGVGSISAPRGLPEDLKLIDNDLSDPTVQTWRGKVWLGDHSYSWLTPDEILDWPGWDKKAEPGDVKTLREYCAVFLAWTRYAKTLADEEGEGRIVFGFDS